MTDTFDDFADLIDRVKQGDRNAMAQLVEQYETELFAFSRVHLGSLLRPYLDSVDLVQSVHRSLLVGVKNDDFDISSPEKLIGVAFTMVRRKVARQWQRARRLIRLRIEGYSTVEAARSLGLDPDVSRVRLSRLRRRLHGMGVMTDLL